ncbi:helix-turn-helix domain-containing protein [Sphingosinicella sp. LHD-64]|uniref:helix-turn-helix domain-containing protein n=1 Tax=Sphingosinicella sp. LHD-64 TaxID=3072139 RepID=UPI00280EF87F|nr:helix-turn-helix domain-containing protein [Sphingosinicella sp. LHD-64]MDQ8758314.1 helix-turn-helix domain-containing protein [Sphingosinicella sp. LHD-64]
MRTFDGQAIVDPAQVRALSSAIRQELVDTLAALGGEADVGALAEQLGRPADGLYYHLRLLVRHGLIEEVESSGQKERRYRLAGEGRLPLRLAYRKGSDGNLPAVGSFARSLLQIAGRDFEQALSGPRVALEGPRRELWAARNKGWVSQDDLEEINALIERLNKLVGRSSAPDRTRLMTFAFVLAPVDPRPKRRKAARNSRA